MNPVRSVPTVVEKIPCRAPRRTLRLLGLLFVACITALSGARALAQQSGVSSRLPDDERARPRGANGMDADSGGARRRERRIRWLESANERISGEANDGLRKSPARSVGLSREERSRLRDEIREAGFSIYPRDTPNYPHDVAGPRADSPDPRSVHRPPRGQRP